MVVTNPGESDIANSLLFADDLEISIDLRLSLTDGSLHFTIEQFELDQEQ